MNMHWQNGLLISLATLLYVGSYDSSVLAQEKAETTENSDDDSDGKKPERRLIRIIGDTKLDVRSWPLIGKPDARYVFVEMFDYTCPHCRDMHHAIKEACERFDDDLAILTLAVPLSTTCNNQIARTEANHRESCELANFAIAVWRIKPEKYREYHDWMFEESRSAAVARSKAVELVGEDALQKALTKQIPQKYVASHVKLYGKAGRGSIPKMLFPNVTLVGNVGCDRLCETIRRELDDE